MLDYACGTGLISRVYNMPFLQKWYASGCVYLLAWQVLAPYTKELIGMDISEGMVEQFNQKVSLRNLSQNHMRK